jgi:hypothetical protein
MVLIRGARVGNVFQRGERISANVIVFMSHGVTRLSVLIMSHGVTRLSVLIMSHCVTRLSVLIMSHCVTRLSVLITACKRLAVLKPKAFQRMLLRLADV